MFILALVVLIFYFEIIQIYRKVARMVKYSTSPSVAQLIIWDWVPNVITFYARSLKQHDQQNQKTDIDATWYLSCKPQILLHIFYSSEEKKN